MLAMVEQKKNPDNCIYKHSCTYIQTDGELQEYVTLLEIPFKILQWNPKSSGQNSMLHFYVWVLLTTQMARQCVSLIFYDP
jgi:hypothetical protein